MKPLEKEFTKGGWSFKQIAREGNMAAYVKRKPNAEGTGHIESFEVIKVVRFPDRTWPNGQTTPAHEGFPAPETWGQQAWTLTTRRDALNKLGEFA